jgi:hypothetical protein
MIFPCMHLIKNVGYIFLGLVCHNLCEFPTYIYFFIKLLTSFMGDMKWFLGALDCIIDGVYLNTIKTLIAERNQISFWTW